MAAVFGVMLFGAQLGCATTNSEKKVLSHTERAQMLIEIANGALAENDPTGALQSLMAAEKEDNQLPELYHSKGLAFYGKHDLNSAIVAVRRAVELKSDYSDANSTLGKLLIDAGKGSEAEPFLNQAANDPLYREAYKPLTNLGVLYYRRGELTRAEGFLSRAIESAPMVACVAFYYRGHIRLSESRLQDAVKDYDNAAKRVCANFADAHLAMGIAYERGKQYDLARKKYLEIQNRYPNTKVAEQAVTHLRLLP